MLMTKATADVLFHDPAWGRFVIFLLQQQLYFGVQLDKER